MPNAKTQRQGETQILCFASGETQILAFSDTNMLVSPTQTSGVGGLSQRQGPTQLFCVGVEYRLKVTFSLHKVIHGKEVYRRYIGPHRMDMRVQICHRIEL